MIIETERLILRRWRPDDIEPFAAMNADVRVMEFYPNPLSKSETEAMIAAMEQKIERQGFGFWATELKQTGNLVGFIGLNVPGYALPFSPCVEIGWRLAFDQWGRGYAQECARAALAFGFDRVGLTEIVAFTAVINTRSRHVMERIGMTHDGGDDFDHPHVLKTTAYEGTSCIDEKIATPSQFPTFSGGALKIPNCPEPLIRF